MISNNLLFYVHFRLNGIFGTVNDKPFTDISVIIVGRFSSWGKACICRL